jgi:TP901 family phage tail tape measure protein
MAGESRALQLLVKLKGLDELSKPLKEAAKAVQETSQQLRKLQDAQKKIQAFRNLQQQNSEASAAMETTRKKLRDLQQQMVSSANPSQRLREEYKQTINELKRLGTSQDRNNNNLAEMKRRLEAAGISTNNLTTHEERLRRSIQQTTQLMGRQDAALRSLAEREAHLKNVREQHAKRMQSLATHAAAGAGMLAGSRMAAGMTAGFLATGVDFDKAMSKVQTQARLAKGSNELAALRKQAMDLGASTAFDATQVAEGQSLLAMAGFDPKQIQASMAGMLNLAKATGTELAQTADISSNILYGFGLDPAEMSRVADVLAATTTRTNVNLADLGDSMKYVSPVAKEMGISLEEASAMAGLLGNVGIKGSQAGTSLRTMVLRLTGPTKKASDALKSLGVDPTDGKGNLRSIPKILADIAKGSQKLGNAERMGKLKAIFGDEPAAAIAELLSKQKSAGLDRFVAELSNVNGEAERMAKTMQDNLAGSIEELSGAFEGLRISISSLVGDDLRNMVTKLTDMISKMDGWVQRNPELAKGILLVVGGLMAFYATLGAVLFIVGSVLIPLQGLNFAMGLMGMKKIPTLGTALKWMFGVLKTGLLWIGKAAMANPVFVMFALLAVAAYLIYKNWDEMKSALKLIYDQLTGWGANLLDGFIKGFTERWQKLKGAVGKLADSVTGFFKDKLGIHSPSRGIPAAGPAHPGRLPARPGREHPANPGHSKPHRQAGNHRRGQGLVVAGSLQADVRAPVVASTTPPAILHHHSHPRRTRHEREGPSPPKVARGAG